MSRAFSLLEILAAVGIVSMLMVVGVPMLNDALERGKTAREVNAARQLATAWISYASENNHQVLPGYKADPAFDAQGNPIGFPSNARYPFRLAPYLDYRLKGSIVVNEREKVLQRADPTYDISVTPSFGINATFVGGDYGDGSDLRPTDAAFSRFGKFVVTHSHEPVRPSMLIVFASARSNHGEGTVEGYNVVKSPRFQASRWSESDFREDSAPLEYGFVDFRHQGKAVAAMCDGHVELLGLDEIRDMRRWSNQAAQADNPDWTLQRL